MPEPAIQLAGDQRQFGRYTLLYRFATGGMADIYLARLTGTAGFEKLVAVKVIHPHLSRHPEFIQMFIDEARLASRISHPNVVQTIELGKVRDAHFIAMEYVDGESVNALLRRTKPSPALCARIIADAAAGLHAAHELRDRDGQHLEVVHRDVSPSNILISYDGSVKVVDFGVARARGKLHSTREGSVKGKFAYMAPEQLSKKARVDRRADVFALGILLYEATIRRHLFKMSDDAATVAEVLYGKIKPPSEYRGQEGYPKNLEQIVLKALERDQERRYQTAQELQHALERFIVQSGEPVLPADVGRLMHQTFTDRVKEKEELLRKCDAVGADVVPEVEMVSGTSMGIKSAVGQQQRPRLVIVGVLGLVIVLALAVMVYLLAFRKRSTTPGPVKIVATLADAGTGAPGKQQAHHARAADAGIVPARQPDSRPTVAARPKQRAVPDASTRQITLEVSAKPKNATITVNGNPVTNPWHLERPAGEGMVEVLVAAPGHESQRFFASLEEGGQWSITLTSDAARSQSDRKRGKIKKRKLKNKDVLVNPYR